MKIIEKDSIVEIRIPLWSGVFVGESVLYLAIFIVLMVGGWGTWYTLIAPLFLAMFFCRLAYGHWTVFICDKQKNSCVVRRKNIIGKESENHFNLSDVEGIIFEWRRGWHSTRVFMLMGIRDRKPLLIHDFPPSLFSAPPSPLPPKSASPLRRLLMAPLGSNSPFPNRFAKRFVEAFFKTSPTQPKIEVRQGKILTPIYWDSI